MRDHCLKSYVTDDELIQIKQSAKESGLSLSEYLRRCSTRRNIHSSIDRQAITDLLKINADLARFGNLLKFTVTEFSDETGDLAKKLTEDAYKHMADTDEMRTLLKQKIANLNW